MKNLKLLFVVLIISITTNISGQDLPNKWSLELNAGTSGFNNFGISTIGNSGNYYSRQIFTPFHINAGVRYMATSILGLKGSIAYDNIKNASASQKFSATYVGLRGEVVVNLGKILKLNELTSRIGLLGHTGLGLSVFSIDENFVAKSATFYKDQNNDLVLTGIIGLTVPVRLTDRFALNFDGSLVAHDRQQLGLSGDRILNPGIIDATIFNATIGVTYSLGKGKKHIDWTDFKEKVEPVVKPEELDILKQKIAALENNNNSNKGVDIATIQRMINERAGKDVQKQQDIAKDLINNGFIASYFDFNVAKPTNESTEGIDFVLNYLRRNPSSNVVITGFADEKGNADYNNKLALNRAENVKTVLEKSGINSSRITVSSGGQDKSVEIDSEWARNTVRKVLFKVQ